MLLGKVLTAVNVRHPIYPVYPNIEFIQIFGFKFTSLGPEYSLNDNKSLASFLT